MELAKIFKTLKHDINQPVSVIRGIADLTIDDLKILSQSCCARDPNIKKIINSALGNQKVCIQALNRLQERLGIGFELCQNRDIIASFKTYPLAEICDFFRDEVKNIAESYGLTYNYNPQGEINKKLEVDMNFGLYSRIIENFANNAQRAGARRLIIKSQPNCTNLIIKVTNDGKLMSLEQKRKCLEENFTTSKTNGSGLGLFFISNVMKEIGGKIKVGPQYFTTFELYHPYRVKYVEDYSI